METNANINEQFEKLKAPFLRDEISFIVTYTKKDNSQGQVAAYVNNSAIQNRLDDVFTPFGWECKFRDWKDGSAQICTISIYDQFNKRWISKEDGAGNTSFEPIKGGLSDSMKRCARMFGIGRYLASEQIFKNSWVSLDENKRISKQDTMRLLAEYEQFLNNYSHAKKQPHSNTEINTSSTKNMIQKNIVTQSSTNNNSEIKQKEKLNPALINVINSLLAASTTNSLASVLKHYKVKELTNLTTLQANDAIKRLAACN